MWTEEPEFEDLLHEHDVAVAGIGTVRLPAPSHPAKYVFLGLKPPPRPRPVGTAPPPGAAAPPASYYIRLVFSPGPRAWVSEYLDAGGNGSLGSIRGIKGSLVDGLLPGLPTGTVRVFLERQLLPALNALKTSVGTQRHGPAGEKLLAKEAEVWVPKDALVHIRYDLVTTAEEAMEDFATLGCEPGSGARRPHG